MHVSFFRVRVCVKFLQPSSHKKFVYCFGEEKADSSPVTQSICLKTPQSFFVTHSNALAQIPDQDRQAILNSFPGGVTLPFYRISLVLLFIKPVSVLRGLASKTALASPVIFGKSLCVSIPTLSEWGRPSPAHGIAVTLTDVLSAMSRGLGQPRGCYRDRTV